MEGKVTKSRKTDSKSGKEMDPPEYAAVKEMQPPSLWWKNWKVWIAVAMVEFAVVLILTAGLAHFASHEASGYEASGQASKSSPDSSLLTVLDRVNKTLQEATKHQESCQNLTRSLEANTSSLSVAVAQLNERLRQKEMESHLLQERVAILGNWTEELKNLNNKQKEIIAHFQQQQKRLSSGSGLLHLHGSHASLLLLTLAGVLCV
ncbi:uncharacterized protein LOC128348061 [Hemicordylus capensis]|uniref:uncharacterized protein LOC128348061 n=1 Tax=Hemicordylus capensis TaxID=884348 RepID=UPI00230470F6|nr:uncharacterized protein LOC128348061 [Hemicordylus capensis]